MYPTVTNVGFMLRSGVAQTSVAQLWANMYGKGEEAPTIKIDMYTITALYSQLTKTTKIFLKF